MGIFVLLIVAMSVVLILLGTRYIKDSEDEKIQNEEYRNHTTFVGILLILFGIILPFATIIILISGN